MFLFVHYSALQDWAQHCGTVVQTADGTETPHTACARAKVWLKSNHNPSQNALWVVLTCHPLAPFHSTSFCAEKAHKQSFLIHLCPLRVSQTCAIALPGW